MVSDKAPHELRRGYHLTVCPRREEIEGLHDDSLMLLLPIVQIHILLDHCDETFVQADPAIAIEDLCDRDFFDPLCLLLLRVLFTCVERNGSSLICLLLRLAKLSGIRLHKVCVIKVRQTRDIFVFALWNLPVKLCLFHSVLRACSLHVLVDERDGQNEVQVKGVE